MTIRSRLLALLLPTLTAFVMLIALFSYFNWSQQILDNFKSSLQSVVVATSQAVNPEEVEWINDHLQQPNLNDDPTYQAIRQKFIQLKQKLPILNLYIVKIEPVKEGDPVILNAKEDSQNSINLGINQENAYRQVFLLDANEKEIINYPGDHDFSETEEHKLYFTKKAFVTPIYEARKTHDRFMSGYAPIFNSQGDVIGLLGADVSVKEIDQRLNNAWLMILIGAAITILMVIGSVFLIADHISKPVQTLNQAALEIAAGNYEANIQVQGPREIVELANTLNTMSECLVENISRLRETSLIRERMYGEYECSLLLQYYMLQKVVEDIRNPFIKVQSLAVNLAQTQRGLLLLWNQDINRQINFTFIEAKDQGFLSLYQLASSSLESLSQRENKGYIDCEFQDKYQILQYHCHHMLQPLVWSVQKSTFIKSENKKFSLDDQSMIFLYNSSIKEQFETQENIEAWFSRILRHFAEDGLETIHTMLHNELNFLAKKEHIKRNFYILGMQMTRPTTFIRS